jgi:twinkle protein
VAGREEKAMSINQTHATFLESRKISVQTAISLGIYSGRLQHEEEGRGLYAVKDESGNALCYPFFKGGSVVNEKYRLPKKDFRQLTGGSQTFYNADVLSSYELIEGTESLVICEGEMDALACIEAGHKFVVSVPAGATSPKKNAFGVIEPVPQGTNDIIPEEDKKFGFIYSNIQELSQVKDIIIATDNDENGRNMADELVRRLVRARCRFIVWPKDVKDMNDVLIKYGPEKVSDLIRTAKYYQLSGVYKFEDIPDPPKLNYVSTGFAQLDGGNAGKLKLTYPALMVITGRASHGKSTWAQQLVTNLANLHGWKCAIASFEMMIKPYVYNSLGAAYLGRPSESWDNADQADVFGFINDNFFPIRQDDEEGVTSFDVYWFLRKAEEAIIRYDVRVILLDPWNQLDMSKDRNESTTEYTMRVLKDIAKFAEKFKVLFIIVAHPTKSGAMKDVTDLDLYDISDSAHFQNRADVGVVIGRENNPDGTPSNISELRVTKTRVHDFGSLGPVKLAYDSVSRTFF